MINSQIPLDADSNYKQYIQRIEALKKENLSKAIPKELYEKNVIRAMTGFITSYTLYIGSIIGVFLAPHWTLTIVFWIAAGLGGWGLHCIAHDCGHGSFSNSRTLNSIIGHLSLIPILYPFNSWKHVHNMHHGSTNHLEMDTDWRPISKDIYDRMSVTNRFVYLFTRSVGFWSGTIHYWWVSAFRPSFYPQKKARNEVRLSILFIFFVSIVLFPTLFLLTGLKGVFFYFIIPLISTHAWFSTTTLMHHTAIDLPFLEKENWSLNGSRILLTIDYLYPKLLLWLTHNISIHSAHHVAPAIPFFNLPKAQQALKEAYPGMIKEQRFSLRTLGQIVTKCHFYDPITGYYVDIRGQRSNCNV